MAKWKKNPERWVGKKVRLTCPLFARGYLEGYVSSIDHERHIWWIRKDNDRIDDEAYGVRFWDEKQLTEI